MKLIFGLGNPEERFNNTPHNLGFAVVDKLCEQFGGTFGKTKMNGKSAEIFVENQKVLLVKPQTYMNSSGKCVQKYMQKYKVLPKDVLVVFDDIDIDAGLTRFRENGSGGSHNGMKDVVLCVGQNVPRLRVGVGKPPENVDLTTFVLAKILPERQQLVHQGIEQAAQKVVEFVSKND